MEREGKWRAQFCRSVACSALGACPGGSAKWPRLPDARAVQRQAVAAGAGVSGRPCALLLLPAVLGACNSKRAIHSCRSPRFVLA